MHEHAQSERTQPITPESPNLPHVGWREVVTREHLPRLLVLCLAIWLHAANTMLAATTMPEAVGDIGGFAAHQLDVRPVPDGFDRGRDSSERIRRWSRSAPHHDALDADLHAGVHHLRRCAGDAGTARGTHGAGARRRCARRAGLHRPGPLLPESAGAADRRVPFAGVDRLGPERAAHRRRVRHRRPVALRLLVVRVAGSGAGGGVAPAARSCRLRVGLAGAASPGRAAGVRRRSDPRDLARGARSGR